MRIHLHPPRGWLESNTCPVFCQAQLVQCINCTWKTLGWLNRQHCVSWLIEILNLLPIHILALLLRRGMLPQCFLWLLQTNHGIASSDTSRTWSFLRSGTMWSHSLPDPKPWKRRWQRNRQSMLQGCPPGGKTSWKPSACLKRSDTTPQTLIQSILLAQQKASVS